MNQIITHVIVGAPKWQKNNPKYRRHRLADYLSKQPETEKVIWVYPVNATISKPLSYVEAVQQLKNGFNEFDSCFYHCSLADIAPGKYKIINGALQFCNLKKLKQELKSCSGKKILWYTIPKFPFIAKDIDWDTIIYDCSDLWMAPTGGKERYFSKLFRERKKEDEDEIIDNSDLIFVTSQYLAEWINKRSNRRAIVVENGVNFEIFRQGILKENAIMEEIPGPRLGFVGGMKHKIDFSLLASLSEYGLNWSIVLIGPGSNRENNEFKDLLTKKNVYWLGEVEINNIPQYISNLDIGLLPYKEIDYNRAVFPLKFFEYLAAGLPVVGCGLPSTERYNEDGIYKHVESGNFVEACTEVLSWRKDEYYHKRIKLAEEANWEDKFSYMYGKVTSLRCYQEENNVVTKDF